jgi:protein-S-isoprenylcysteine O-methyltransferase Ste14
MDWKEEYQKIDVERVIVVPVFSFLMLMNILASYSYLRNDHYPDVASILYAIRRGLIICFYLLVIILFFARSQAKATTRSRLARTLAYVGTFAPFLLIFFKDGKSGNTPALFSICIMLGGLAFAIYSLKTLGRSIGIMPQARTLVRSGPYRLIRHPLYVGEIVSFGGFIIAEFTMAKLGIFLLTVAIQLYRAIQEEKLLEKTIPEYLVYESATKRFVPWVI